MRSSSPNKVNKANNSWIGRLKIEVKEIKITNVRSNKEHSNHVNSNRDNNKADQQVVVRAEAVVGEDKI